MWAGQAETRTFIVVDPGYEVDLVDWDTPNQPHNPNQPSNSARQLGQKEAERAWDQPMPSAVRSSRRSEPCPGISVNAPDFSARW